MATNDDALRGCPATSHTPHSPPDALPALGSHPTVTHAVLSPPEVLAGLATVADSHPDVRLTVSVSASERFNGDLSSRQHLPMTLGDFYARLRPALDGAAAASDAPRLYLAQCSFVRAEGAADLPQLAAHVPRPAMVPPSVTEANLWASPVRTRTNLHYDARHNLLVVVAGEKQVTLFSPAATPLLKPLPLFGDSGNHSSVDAFSLAGSDLDAKAVRLLVRAGDGVFIPEGWWHAVDSSPGTVAVNFWWQGIHTTVTAPDVAPYALRVALQSEVARARTANRMSTMSQARLNTPDGTQPWALGLLHYACSVWQHLPCDAVAKTSPPPAEPLLAAIGDEILRNPYLAGGLQTHALNLTLGSLAKRRPSDLQTWVHTAPASVLDLLSARWDDLEGAPTLCEACATAAKATPLAPFFEAFYAACGDESATLAAFTRARLAAGTSAFEQVVLAHASFT